MKNVCNDDNNNDNSSNIIRRSIRYCKVQYGMKIFCSPRYTIFLGLRSCRNKAASIKMITQKKLKINLYPNKQDIS